MVRQSWLGEKTVPSLMAALRASWPLKVGERYKRMKDGEKGHRNLGREALAAIIQLALFSRQQCPAKLELVLNSHRKEAVGRTQCKQAGSPAQNAQFLCKNESHVLACFCFCVE